MTLQPHDHVTCSDPGLETCRFPGRGWLVPTPEGKALMVGQKEEKTIRNNKGRMQLFTNFSSAGTQGERKGDREKIILSKHKL